MKHLKSKKAFGLLVVLVVGGIAAFGAYAFFTDGGSGTGTASVGNSSTIDLSSDPVGTLYPGGADVDVTVDISNPGSGVQHVGTISGTVEDNGGCLGSWFEVDSVPYNADLGPGALDSADTVVRMLDSGTNQDACQGLDLTIDWSSN